MRTVAIVAAYNEADVIAHAVGALIEQGVQVYVLDDGSTDGTIAALEPFLSRGLLAVERFSEPAPTPAPYDWEGILRRKTDLARTLDADWFIHHDADEFRESPWSGVTLGDAIARVDALGYNAIDFASLDFWPMDDAFQPGTDVRDALTHYMERAPYDRLQIRCWKKAPDVELVSTGGHEARFDGRRVFPIRFISRHYPIRGQAHGERKVFRERQTRFLEHERAKGWHVQYDGVREGTSFLRDQATLERYDPETVRIRLAMRHRGVEELEERLAAERAAIDGLRRDVAAREEELRRAAAGLSHTEAELSGTQRALAGTQRALADTQALLAKAAADAAQLGERLARTHDDLLARGTHAAALQDELDRRIREIEQWRAAADDHSQRLEALHGSLSWRLTAPLRAALRLLRRS